MGKGSLPKSDTRTRVRKGSGRKSDEGGDEAVRLRDAPSEPERRGAGISVEIDPTIPDPPRAEYPEREFTVGIGASNNSGRGRTSKNAHEKLDEKLGIHSKLPTVLPFVSTMAFVYRHVGGVPAAIEAAKLVAEKDERFKQLAWMYDECPEHDKHKLKLEVLCQQCAISQGDFIGLTMSAMHERNLDIGNMIASAAHPRVVEATIENATRANGFMDRQMLHQHSGFIPTAKGTQINIDNSKKVLNANGGAIQQIPSVEGGPTRMGLPSFEEETMSATRAIRGDAGMGFVGKKALPAPTPEQAVEVPIEAEFVDVQPE